MENANSAEKYAAVKKHALSLNQDTVSALVVELKNSGEVLCTVVGTPNQNAVMLFHLQNLLFKLSHLNVNKL